MTTQDVTAVRVRAARHSRGRRRRWIIAVLVTLVIAAFAASLMGGEPSFSPGQVVRVVLGQPLPGAAEFIVGRLRLPRAGLAIVVGLSFGLAGVTFQTLLRNPLASPDVIGITEGASAAAVIAIVSFHLSGLTVSAVAVAAGLGVAIGVYLVSYRNGVADTRLILIGIGVAAMMQSIISWQLERAGSFEIAQALRWLTGSLNGALWTDVVPVAATLLGLGTVVLVQTRNLAASQLGKDTASALGIRIERMRAVIVIAAVGLVCVATAAAGPIAFVAFLSGPIASRITGNHGSLLIPAALVGALLTLLADFAGQYAFGLRLPVGVVTGILGAPYLLYLIVRINRTGATL